MDDRYLTDWSRLRRGVPAELHRPTDVTELSAIVERCHANKQRITIQGGLTGLAGGAVPDDGDVVINLERMNRIESIDEVEGVMVVQAGATLQQVQEAADAVGWYFPVDLGARGSCQVGGNAATNAGGDKVLRYGTMRDSILGLEVVLADGTVLDSTTRLVKNSAGLDLRFLFIGSEGTLGIITKLVLRLQPRPGEAATAFASTNSVQSLSLLLRDLRRDLGGMLSAFEFMSDRFVQIASRLSGQASPLTSPAPWHVLIEASGAAGDDASGRLQAALERALERDVIVDCAVAASLSDAEDFWRLRESIPEMLTHLAPTINFDCGLPGAEMPAFIEHLEPKLHERWPEAEHLFFGHLGDNNVHLMTGPHDKADMEAVDQLVYGALAGRKATISAEHGVGFLKKPYLGVTRSAVEIDLLRQLKKTLDPAGILNPGRVFDA